MYNQNYYSADVIKDSIKKSYLWMALGLILTAGVAALLYSTNLFYVIIFRAPILILGSFIIQIVLCFLFGSAMRSSTSVAIKAMFIVYSLTMGVSMTSIAYSYDLGTISLAFIISAVYFIALAIIGSTTKMDLSRIGNICLIGLLVMVISQIFMLIFSVSFNVRMISIVGLLLFTGITAWDVQRMNSLLVMSNGYPVEQEKISIYMALQLYLDFINIFLYIIRLLGIGSKRD